LRGVLKLCETFHKGTVEESPSEVNSGRMPRSISAKVARRQ
jgi:hypothetical protein